MSSPTRISLPATIATHATDNYPGMRSEYIRSAMIGFARSKKCGSKFVQTSKTLNTRQSEVATKISIKFPQDFLKTHRRIANKVVTDRPKGERFSRYVAAAIAWEMSK